MKRYFVMGIMLSILTLSTACATPDTGGLMNTISDARFETQAGKAEQEVEDMSDVIKCGRQPECAKKWRKEIYPDSE